MLLPRNREAALLEHPPGSPVKHRINAKPLPVFTFSPSETEKRVPAPNQETNSFLYNMIDPKSPTRINPG